MRRFYLFFAVLSVMLVSNNTPLYAHTLKVDGKIGVTMHIEPDDEPVAKQTSRIIISIQDKSNQLQASPESCQCSLTIMQGGKTLETIDLNLNNGSVITNYTFPDAGSYKLEVAGAPRSGYSFQTFSVVFTYTVKSQVGGTTIVKSVTVNPLRTNAPFVVIGAASVLLALFALPTKPRKKAHSK